MQVLISYPRLNLFGCAAFSHPLNNFFTLHVHPTYHPPPLFFSPIILTLLLPSLDQPTLQFPFSYPQSPTALSGRAQAASSRAISVKWFPCEIKTGIIREEVVRKGCGAVVGTGGVKKVTPSHRASSPLLKLHLIQQKAVGRSVVELICCLFYHVNWD